MTYRKVESSLEMEASLTRVKVASQRWRQQEEVVRKLREARDRTILAALDRGATRKMVMEVTGLAYGHVQKIVEKRGKRKLRVGARGKRKAVA